MGIVLGRGSKTAFGWISKYEFRNPINQGGLTII
jgi:hypothetical protein